MTEENSAQDPPELALPLSAEDIEKQKELVKEVLRHIYDPEIPINIYDLGLIYDIEVTPEAAIHVKMTLTSPNCPEAEVLPSTAQLHIRSVLRNKNVNVEVVWDPPWSWERMSEAARLEFNF